MRTRQFLSLVDHDRILHAIQAAEKDTTGDIVLMIRHCRIGNPLEAAHRAYEKFHLGDATDKNSFLIFLAPRSRNFALVGGPALHEKVGQAWWDELSDTLSVHFREDRYTDGLVAAIEKAGQAFKAHFPAQGDINRSGQKDIVEES